MDKNEVKLLKDSINKLIEDFKNSAVSLGIPDFSKEPELVRFLNELKGIKKLITSTVDIQDVSDKISKINIETGNISVLSLFGMYKKLLSDKIPKTQTPTPPKPVKQPKAPKVPRVPKVPGMPNQPNTSGPLGAKLPNGESNGFDKILSSLPDMLTKAVTQGMIETNKILHEQVAIDKANDKEQDRKPKEKKDGFFGGILGSLLMFKGITGLIPMVIGGLGTLIGGLFAILVGTGAINIESILSKLGEFKDRIMPQVQELFKSLGEAFNSLLPVVLNLIEQAMPYLLESIKYIGDAIVKAMPFITSVVMNSIPYIVDLFKWIIEGVKKISTGDISGNGVLISLYAIWKLLKFTVWVGAQAVKAVAQILSYDYKSSLFGLPIIISKFLMKFKWISNIVESINNMFKKLDWIPKMFNKIKSAIVDFKKAFDPVLKGFKSIYGIVSSIIKPLFTVLTKIPILGKFFSLLGGMFKMVVGLFKFTGSIFSAFSKLGPLLSTAGPLLRGMKIFSVIFAVIDFLKGFLGTEGSFLDKLKAGLTEAVMGFIGLPLQILGWIGDKILGIFGIEIEGGLGAKFIDTARTMLDTFFGFFTGIIQNIIDILTGLWDKAKSIIDAIIPDFLKGDPKKAEEKADRKARIESLTSTLEKDKVIDKNIFGKSEIKDWTVVDRMSHGEIQTLIDYNDWDKETSKKLKKLLDEKAPGDMKSAHGKSTAGDMLLGKPSHKVNTVESLKRSVPEYYGRVPSSEELGALSAKYESKGNAGTISSGKGDYGGVSYGTYQMMSRGGKQSTVGKYINDSEYAQDFAGLTPGTKEFSDKWTEIHKRDGDKFGKSQHDYIKKTHYDPVAQKAGAIGLNLSERGKALQDVVWSTAVHHGGDTSVIDRALKGKDVSKMSDEEIIKAIYAERGRRNETGDLAYFSKNSKDVQDSVANRFVNEQKDALAMNAKGGKPYDTSKAMEGMLAKTDTKAAIQPNIESNQKDYIGKAESVTKSEYDIKSAEGVPRVDPNRVSSAANAENTYASATQLTRQQPTGYDLAMSKHVDPRVDISNVDRIQREINEKEFAIENNKIQVQEYQNRILNDSKTSMTKGFASIKEVAGSTGDTYNTSGNQSIVQNNVPTDIENLGVFLINSGWV